MNTAIILAGGSGERFGSGTMPKQLVALGGKPLFVHCLETYRGMSEIDRICLVVNPRHSEDFVGVLRQRGWQDGIVVAQGGSTRQASIASALDALPPEEGGVIIHNAASPFTSAGLIRKCLSALATHQAVQAYVPAEQTIFEKEGDVLKTLLPRQSLGMTCDPTVYDMALLRRAMEHQQRRHGNVGETTLSIVQELGVTVTLVPSDRDNIKLTTTNDLRLAEAIEAGRTGGR